MINENKKVLLLFSGGQDSTTLLAWCLKKYKEIHVITFKYGQRHIVEINAAKNIIKHMKQNYKGWPGRIANTLIYDMNKISTINSNALTEKINISNKEGIPNTFVPGRNLFFYIFGATYAYDKKINHIVSGVCQTDYSGYPDCRNETIKQLNKTVNLGMEKKFIFKTPLMKKTKSDTWKMAYNIGGKRLLKLIREKTHTCYLGEKKKLNDWGYGCKKCPACVIRSKGWKEFYKKEGNLSL